MAKSLRTTHDLVTSNLRAVIQNLQTAAADMVMNSAGLAIKAGGSAVVKSVNTVTAMIDGVLVSKAAADMAALVGTIAAAKKGVFVFTLKADGTLTTRAGLLTAASLAAITFPAIPAGEVVVGFLVVENGTASDFVGGTTALDTASLTCTYVNTPFPFNPNVVTL